MIGVVAVEADGGGMRERLLVRHGQEMDLLGRWWNAVGDLERAESRLSRLAATRERRMSGLLEGMTTRQRSALGQRSTASWRSSWGGRRYRDAMRRRQMWAARQPALRRLEAEWAPRLEAAQAEMDSGRRVLAGVASEALAAWPVRPERFTGRTGRQLQRLAHRVS
jgi:hypothetical protein